MAYPSTLSTLATPNPTDRLNNPSHSALHQNENAGILEIQRFVGLDGAASVVGTLDYDIRSPASNGGGHVQTANKGGTGQTSYNKGDLLVGQSSSVLTKLAVGTDGQALRANSSVASGVAWSNVLNNKLASSASVITVTNTGTETSILSVSVPGGTLSTNNALRARLFIKDSQFGNGAATGLLLRGNYGTTTVATVTVGSVTGGNASSVFGVVELNIVANNSSSAQRGNLITSLPRSGTFAMQVSSFVGRMGMAVGTAAEDSSVAKTLGITAQWTDTSTDDRFTVDSYVVEQITG